MKPILTICIVVLFLGIFLKAIPGIGNDEFLCVDLLKNKCTDCHTTERICRNLLKEWPKIWWQSNIENMVAYGAEYTQKEQDSFLVCLLKPYSDLKILCD